MSKKEFHVVFDRDGTLIGHVHYLSKPEQVYLLPGVKEGIKKLQQNQVSFSLHTNQSGVGRMYFSMDDVIKCNNKMFGLLDLKISSFTEICIATEAPNQVIKYRKPSPNFGIELIKKYNYDLKNIFYIGDTFSDYQTAINLGCNFVGLDTGLVKLSSSPNIKQESIIIKNNFLSAIDHITGLL